MGTVVRADSPVYCMVVGPQRPCFQAKSLPFEWLIVGLQSGVLLRYDAQGACVARYSEHSQAVFAVGTTNDGMLISGSRDESVLRWCPGAPCEFCTGHCPPRLGAQSNCRCERCRFFRELWETKALRIQDFFRNRKKARLRRLPRLPPEKAVESPPREPTPPQIQTPLLEVRPEEPEPEQDISGPPFEEPEAPLEPIVLPPLPRKRCGGGFSLVYPSSNRRLGSSASSSVTNLRPTPRAKSSGRVPRGGSSSGSGSGSGSAEKRSSSSSTALEYAHVAANGAANAAENACSVAMTVGSTVDTVCPINPQIKRSNIKFGSTAKSISGKGAGTGRLRKSI